MRIFKRSDSSFYWIDYVKDGQRVRMSLKTTRKAEAQERADEIRKHQWLVDQGLAIEKAIIYTLSDLATNYENTVIDVNDKSEGSKSTDKRWVNRFVDHIGGHTELDKITETECNNFVSYWKTKVEETTLHKGGQILRQMFNYASRPPYNAKYNPFEWAQGVKQLSKKGKKQLPCPWDLVIKAIDDTTNIKDKMFWTLLAYTGMTYIDAKSVQKSDFKRGYYQRSKTSVRFMIWLHPEIKKYGDAIFGLYQNRSTYDDSARRFRAKTGFQLKSVRKTFASTLLTQFESAEDAIAYTGHTNIKTLVDHYATVDPEQGKRKLEQMFANA
jgi:integrase